VKKVLLLAVFLGLLILSGVFVYFSFNENMKRNMKSTYSNYTGGLKRRVVIVSPYTNKIVKEWKGKFDIDMARPNNILFDVDGKRVDISRSNCAIIYSEEIDE
jgi:hypothetical protein